MPSLYRRLKQIGFDRPFVRRAILPDWWDDKLAEDASLRMQMHLRIARRLGLPMKDVADSTKTLALPEVNSVRLKRARQGSDRDAIAPGIVVARRTVALAISQLHGFPVFPAHLSAAALRSSILKSYPVVDFAGLVKAAWAHGIAVFHFKEWPLEAKKFAGMAYYEGNVPVVVIASGYDAPPRLAFYLAHEIGHILRGHVKPDGKVLVDGDLDSTREDVEEREADEDALAILCGEKLPPLPQGAGMTPPKLKTWSRLAEGNHTIHAGTAALIFGRERKHMPLANMVLKALNMDTGGHAIIAAETRRHLLPEDGSVEVRELSPSLREVLPLLGISDI